MILYVKKLDYFDKELISLLTNNNNYNSNNVCNQNIIIIPSSLTSSKTTTVITTLPIKSSENLPSSLLTSSSSLSLSSSSSSTSSTTTTTTIITSSIKSENLILATSVFNNVFNRTKKRKYLEDYKDFKEAFHLKSIFIEICKGIGNEISELLLDMFDHSHRKYNAEKEGKRIPEYDVELQVTIFLNNCITTPLRFLSVSWIKKSYELYASLYFDHRIADKLTKDISKSLIRKISRMSRFEASRKIIKTTLNASAIFALSSFTYDILYNIYDMVIDSRELISKSKLEYLWYETYTELSGKKPDSEAFWKFKNCTIWVLKRCGFYVIISFGSAVGFSIGSYIGGVRIGGLVVGQNIGQFIFKMLINNFLN